MRNLNAVARALALLPFFDLVILSPLLFGAPFRPVCKGFILD